MNPTDSYPVEQALLGAVLCDASQYDSLRGLVRPSSFQYQPFSWVWSAIESLHAQKLDIDVMTVANELQRAGKLDDFATPDAQFHKYAAVSAIAGSYVYDTNTLSAESYARQVMEHAGRRQFRSILEMAGGELARGGRPLEVLQSETIRQLTGVPVMHAAATRTRSMADAVSLAYDQTAAASRGEIRAVPTGFIDLDKLMRGGLRGPDLVVLAARPGQGKTSLLLNIAKNAADADNRVAFFSLEMGAEQVAMRLIAMESGVEYGKQLDAKMRQEEWDAYWKAAQKLTDAEKPLPITINDTPAITKSGIRQELNRMGPVDLVIVDYLQLMGTDGQHENRTREVSEISAGLKALAKEFNVPVLAAAQLSRALEQRSDKRPVLSDLRESGTIENDADIVEFIYRPDQYEKDSAKQNVAQVIIGKHRNGALGTVELIFVPHLTLFKNATKREVRF